MNPSQPALRSSLRHALALLGLALAVMGFCALGVWQLQRREWKHDLIARVESRIHAPATPAPISDNGEAYRHVFVRGHYLQGQDTLVTASTDLGAGFWLITPLVQDDGSAVLINRGFIPSNMRKAPPPPPLGPLEVVGLLRLTEPKGGFLRDNVPAEARWYSRDVLAIANAHHIPSIRPYFIDAEAESAPWPRGGLTVVTFPDSHLIYALTWFAMALTVLWFAVHAHRQSRR